MILSYFFKSCFLYKLFTNQFINQLDLIGESVNWSIGQLAIGESANWSIK